MGKTRCLDARANGEVKRYYNGREKEINFKFSHKCGPLTSTKSNVSSDKWLLLNEFLQVEYALKKWTGHFIHFISFKARSKM